MNLENVHKQVEAKLDEYKSFTDNDVCNTNDNLSILNQELAEALLAKWETNIPAEDAWKRNLPALIQEIYDQWTELAKAKEDTK